MKTKKKGIIIKITNSEYFTKSVKSVKMKIDKSMKAKIRVSLSKSPTNSDNIYEILHNNINKFGKIIFHKPKMKNETECPI